MELKRCSPELARKLTEIKHEGEIYGEGYTFIEDGTEFYTNKEGGISGDKDTTPEIIPTLELARMYLREKYNIDVSSIPTDGKKYDYSIVHFAGENNNMGIVSDTAFIHDSYEEALELALLKAIEIIIEYKIKPV